MGNGAALAEGPNWLLTGWFNGCDWVWWRWGPDPRCGSLSNTAHGTSRLGDSKL